MAKAITTEQLVKAHACPRETVMFYQSFGAGGEATEAHFLSVATKFDWPFAAHILLTKRQQQEFKVRCLAAFRGIRRGKDVDQRKRRTAMALAFYQAYNGVAE